MYRSFCKWFEKKFYLKSDDQIEVYLGKRITQDRAKVTVTMSQEHYLMACLEKFGLTDCIGVDKPIFARLSVQNQSEVTNPSVQELYRGMVGSFLYLASWTRPNIAFAVSELSRLFPILANSIWKQLSVCSVISKRLCISVWYTARHRPPCHPIHCKGT